MVNFNNLRVYKHEFLSDVYLNPPTMDDIIKQKQTRRRDFLFLEGEIKIGKIEPHKFPPVEVAYALLTQPDATPPVYVFKAPYMAHVREEHEFTELKNKQEIAEKVLDPLCKLRDQVYGEHNTLQQFLNDLSQYLDPQHRRLS